MTAGRRLGWPALAVFLCVALAGSAIRPAGSGAPAPGASPLAASDRLVIGYRIDAPWKLSNTPFSAEQANLLRAVFSSLYTFGPELRPVPDLADGMPEVTEGGRTWTIRLRDGVRFHDGSALDSADVVSTYELAASPRCPYAGDWCPAGLSSVRAIDPLTVELRFDQPNSHVWEALAQVVITSSESLGASWERYAAGARGVGNAELSVVRGTFAAELASPSGMPAEGDDRPAIDWDGLIERATDSLTAADIALPRGDDFRNFAGEYVPADHGAELQRQLDALDLVLLADAASRADGPELRALLARIDAAASAPTGPPDEAGNATPDWAPLIGPAAALLEEAGIALDADAFANVDGRNVVGLYESSLIARVRALGDAGSVADTLASVYLDLDVQERPNGSGPFRLASRLERRASVELDRFDDYFGGPSFLAGLSVRYFPTEDRAAAALASGAIDVTWVVGADAVRQLRASEGVRTFEWATGFAGLYFNLREGRLFADRNLRHAVAMCFDKRSTVAHATAGNAIPTDSDISPGSWAYPADLEQYPHEPERARTLIEASGWSAGTDGVYVKDGRRLSTTVAVRAGDEFADRLRFMRRLAEQVAACGIELDVREVPSDQIFSIVEFPHVNPAAVESGEPFDAYFGVVTPDLDPDPNEITHSSGCTTAEQPLIPGSFNLGCYANPAVDRLLDAARAESDHTRRAELYRQYARVQSRDLPILYAWSDLFRDAARTTVASADGFVTGTPYWHGNYARIFKREP